ncbi:MAG: TadE family protein [Acidobacteriaceae bacterium]
MTVQVKRWKCAEGSSTVEFSLIAVIFVMLLLGVIEMGRMILAYTTIAQAAKAGARYAIVHGSLRSGGGASGPSGPGNTTQIETVVKNFASAGALNTVNVTTTVTYPTVSGTCGTNGPGCPVQVKVTYPFTPLLSYFNPMLSMTLSSTSKGAITF